MSVYTIRISYISVFTILHKAGGHLIWKIDIRVETFKPCMIWCKVVEMGGLTSDIGTHNWLVQNCFV